MVDAVNLPVLSYSARIANPDGTPTRAFYQFMEKTRLAIQSYLDAINQNIEDIQTALEAAGIALEAAEVANDAAEAANTAASNAQDAADQAQDTADEIDAAASLNTSYASGLTITATDAGTDATITLSAHTRLYGNGTSVSVNGGSLTALAYSTSYWIYYDQASRAGGAVTYASTTTVTDAFTSGANPDRHFVGAVITPAAAGAPTSGKAAKFPSYSEI